MNRYEILKHPERKPYTSEQAEQDLFKELEKNFAPIQRWDLKVNTIVCSVCGSATSLNGKNKATLCEHLAFIKEIDL